MRTKIKNSKPKGITLSEFETSLYGKKGTPKRDEYDTQLKLELIGELIKQIREHNNLTQTQLGKKLGMDKTYVSRMENNLKTQRLDTIIKVFKALKATMFIRVEGEDGMKVVELI